MCPRTERTVPVPSHATHRVSATRWYPLPVHTRQVSCRVTVTVRCTPCQASSNATKVLQWAFERGKRVFFFPDQHLGRNTGVKLGVPLDQMLVWDPDQPLGGEHPAQVRGHLELLVTGVYGNPHSSSLTSSASTAPTSRADSPKCRPVAHRG